MSESSSVTVVALKNQFVSKSRRLALCNGRSILLSVICVMISTGSWVGPARELVGLDEAAHAIAGSYQIAAFYIIALRNQSILSGPKLIRPQASHAIAGS
ncbi:hypothetical protein J6590_101235 [Homalodisca vitripennis]|nr:hypothetical protein J6590_101235 [Homalodisca vitripennis]